MNANSDGDLQIQYSNVSFDPDNNESDGWSFDF
jgi:hypothetical protein